MTLFFCNSILLTFIISCVRDNGVEPDPDPLPDTTYWEKTYGYSDARAYSVQQTSDGGFILVGDKWVSINMMSDVFVVRTDSIGETMWTKTFGGYDVDIGYDIKLTNYNRFIITGSSWNSGAGGSDVYLILTDSIGDLIWSKRYGGYLDDNGWETQQTVDGGFIIAGGTYSFGSGSRDVYLIKTDANGDTLWTKTYGGDTLDWATSLDITSDGGFIVAGHTMSYGAGDYDIYLIRTDMNGDTLWTKTYGGPDWEYGNSVRATSDGGYIIAGLTWSYGKGNGDFYLIKTDSIGDILFARTYGGDKNEAAQSVFQTIDGGYILTGYTYSFGAGRDDVYLIRTDSFGEEMWNKTFGGDGVDGGNSVIQTSNLKFVVAGYSAPYSTGDTQFYLLCLDKE